MSINDAKEIVASIPMDASAAHEATKQPRVQLIEVVLKTSDSELDEKLRLIKELSYPLPVVAKIEECEGLELHLLLERIAVAGLSGVIFQTSSDGAAKDLKDKAVVINNDKRLGLTFKFI